MIDGNTAALKEKMHDDDVSDAILEMYGPRARQFLIDEIEQGGVLIDYVDENRLGELVDAVYTMLHYPHLPKLGEVAKSVAWKIIEDATEAYCDRNFGRAIQEVKGE